MRGQKESKIKGKGQGMGRRTFLKSGTIGLGAALAGPSLFGVSKALSAGKIKVPPMDNRFKDVKLTATTDPYAKAPFDWYSSHLQKESGLEFAKVQVFPSGADYETMMPELSSKKDRARWDIVEFTPQYFGDVVGTGGLESLSKYFEKYEGGKEFLDQIVPVYKEFYMKWDGEIYALPFDGDIIMLHYRPSLFSNEKYKGLFEKEYNYPLEVPKTWRQYLDVAKFFTEKGPKGVYGTQVIGAKPFNWYYYISMAAGNGMKYFSEDMEPLINSKEAVEALEVMVESIRWSPPGSENFAIEETISNWQQGVVAMSLWWIDLAEFTAQYDVPVVGDQGGSLIPGWEKNGKIVTKCVSAGCRGLAVPKALPDEVKEAAFYAIYRLSHDDYSKYSIADPWCGLDPYLWSHYERPETFTQPNPLRGTTPDYPTNKGMFKTVERTKNHLAAGKASMANAFPGPNWPGGASLTNALSISIQRALAGQVSAKQALDDTAKQWADIVKKRGRKDQIRLYGMHVQAMKNLGMW